MGAVFDFNQPSAADRAALTPVVRLLDGRVIVPIATYRSVRLTLELACSQLEQHEINSLSEIRLLRAAQQCLPFAEKDFVLTSDDYQLVCEAVSQGLHQLSICGFSSTDVAAMAQAHALLQVPKRTRRGLALATQPSE